MRYTSNYNMVIGEGTDAVNPLTQIFPNFEIIDTAMENNKNAGITTASEVTTGGVHAIVRVNTSVPVFRFTATSAWTTGDTMTLDGSAVTVHLTDGTAPKSGAYVIGAEVVGVVNGSLVTLLAGASFEGVLSFNGRQNVVLPQSGDYTANMIGYNNTASGLIATDEQGAIDELANKIKDSGWIVVSPAFRYRKIGSVVCVDAVSQSGSGWQTVGTLPADCRPSAHINICCYSDANNNANLNILTSGEVRILSTFADLNCSTSFAI